MHFLIQLGSAIDVRPSWVISERFLTINLLFRQKDTTISIDIVYYSIGFTELALEFGVKLAKVMLGLCYLVANFNAGFLKPRQ